VDLDSQLCGWRYWNRDGNEKRGRVENGGEGEGRERERGKNRNVMNKTLQKIRRRIKNVMSSVNQSIGLS
jgi:hypothetical protein